MSPLGMVTLRLMSRWSRISCLITAPVVVKLVCPRRARTGRRTVSPTFRRASREVYDEQRNLPLPVAVVLSLGLAVPGEELFWRGLFQGKASGVFGHLGGAVATWLCYVVVNATSGLLALVAGALVGGVVWGALAWWTHGVLAALLCHGVWTGLMLVRPPVARPASMRIRV